MAKKYQVNCRYGKTYDVELKGTKGAIVRTIDMLNKCCCFVCHNHSCKEPHDEKIDCLDECKFYWKLKPCENYGKT